jgi:hypothetical protein
VAASRRAFAYTASYEAAQVSINGEYATYRRIGDEGRWADFHFCPQCGGGVFYEIEMRPGMISVPAGGFGDRDFPAPFVEVFENRRAEWCIIQMAGPLAQE